MSEKYRVVEWSPDGQAEPLQRNGQRRFSALQARALLAERLAQIVNDYGECTISITPDANPDGSDALCFRIACNGQPCTLDLGIEPA